MSSKTFFSRFLLTSIILFLSACASGPRSVSISESELQQRLTEELSVPITLLKIFDIALTNPVIRLDEGTERMHAEMDTRISNPLSSEPITGKINLSGKLAFDASRNAIMLTESKVEKLNFRGMGLDEKYSELFNVLAAQLGGQLLNNVTLYTLKPDDLKVGNTRYAPTQFNIVGNNLKVTLQPQ